MMRFFVAILFLLLSQFVAAQVDVESISMGVDSLEEDTVIMVESQYTEEKKNRSGYLDSIANISAPFSIKDPRFVQKGETKYILQDRYLPVGGKFSKWLFDRLDVGVQSGYSWFAPWGDKTLKGAMPLGVYAKYNINRLHAVRLGYSHTSFGIEGYGAEIAMNDFDLDYMFNISSFLYGHNVRRVLNVSAMLGLGYAHTSFREEKQSGLGVRAGLNFDIKMTSSSHLFIEPYVSLVDDKLDYSNESNSHKWDMMYGVRAGIGVNFNTKRDTLKNANYNGGIFWDFTQGATFFSSDDVGLMESMGSAYALSIGKWLDPRVGIRLTGTAADYSWSVRRTAPVEELGVVVVPSYETKMNTVMVGGRLELLFDVLNIVNSKRRNRMFGWQLSVGGEFGYMRKVLGEDALTNLKTYYAGFVAGTQFVFTPQDAMSFFLEPRMLIANYSIPYANAPEYKARFSDNMYSVNVGIRVSNPINRPSKEESGTFSPNNFVGLSGGLSRKIHYQNKLIEPATGTPLSGGIVVGREFAPLVAAKLQVDYQHMTVSDKYYYSVDADVVYKRPAMFDEKFSLLNVKLAYMLNFTNLYQGYRPNRLIDVFLELGPSYIFSLGRTCTLGKEEMAGGTNPTPIMSGKAKDKGVFAMFGGLTCAIRLNEKFRITLEPYAQYMMNSSIFSGASSASQSNLFTGVNVGVNYNF